MDVEKDDLAQRWQKLSLSVEEGNKVDLSLKKKAGEHVLALKFLTHWNINIEAVAHTFWPLWRTRGNFEVNDVGKTRCCLILSLKSMLKKSLWGNCGPLTGTWLSWNVMTVLRQYKVCILEQPPSRFKYVFDHGGCSQHWGITWCCGNPQG